MPIAGIARILKILGSGMTVSISSGTERLDKTSVTPKAKQAEPNKKNAMRCILVKGPAPFRNASTMMLFVTIRFVFDTFRVFCTISP